MNEMREIEKGFEKIMNTLRSSTVDSNSVKLSGTMHGPVSLYDAKGQTRFEFVLKSTGPTGTYVLMQIQGRGNLANDLFQVFKEGREIIVEGRLKARRYGRICVVLTRFDVFQGQEPLTISDLTMKLDLMRLLEETRKEKPDSNDPDPDEDDEETGPASPLFHIPLKDCGTCDLYADCDLLKKKEYDEMKKRSETSQPEAESENTSSGDDAELPKA